jgi:dTDP-4-dehydrorhamnose 3,5-epimerase
MADNPVRLLQPRRHGDDRGWFSETFREKDFSGLISGKRFVQDNHSLSAVVGTLRGIHFQAPPHAQDKLVRCVRGRIFDVAVDLRAGSPTYGKWVGAELSAANGKQLLVPIGFGHAFVTREPNAEVIYKVTDYYAPDCDGGIAWNDPTIAIDWQLGSDLPQLSLKDTLLQLLRDFVTPFPYDGHPLLALEGR